MDCSYEVLNLMEVTDRIVLDGGFLTVFNFYIAKALLQDFLMWYF